MDQLLLTELERLFLDVLHEAAGSDAVADEQQLAELVEAERSSTRTKLVATILKGLRRRAPKMLRERRLRVAGFEKRNFRRWRKPFDQLEMLIVMAEELGECNDVSLRKQAQEEQDYKFEALSKLHPRAVLVSREILCLLKGGFPDGALARWRSLHELAVTALFIGKHEQSIALRYLASFGFRSLHAAKELNEHAALANLESFDAGQMSALEESAAAAERQIGVRLEDDYDWAKPAIGKRRITFREIEKNVGMEHWRPRYRWASQHTHGGHRPPDRMLGVVESVSPVLLVGPSNSGFTDPLQMAAISLTQMATAFLLHKPNLDRIVYLDVMWQLADELGPLSLQTENETLRAHREKHTPQNRLLRRIARLRG